MPGKARIGEAEHRNEFEKTRCFVENLDFDTEWPALKDHFLMAGCAMFCQMKHATFE